jgi:hypothetical protein
VARVFVSYSSVDRAAARQLHWWLQAAGLIEYLDAGGLVISSRPPVRANTSATATERRTRPRGQQASAPAV